MLLPLCCRKLDSKRPKIDQEKNNLEGDPPPTPLPPLISVIHALLGYKKKKYFKEKQIWIVEFVLFGMYECKTLLLDPQGCLR